MSRPRPAARSRSARDRGPAPANQRAQAASPDRVIFAGQMLENAGVAADLLKAIANPHRLRVLCLLAGGEMSVGQINEAIDLSQSALSQHLAVLRENALVAVRRHSQTMFYSLAAGPVQDIIEVLHRTYCASPAGSPCRERTR